MQNALNHFQFFAHTHDELPAFHAGYLVLTLLAATMLNLGVFAALIALHMALDVVKYRDYHGFSWSLTIEATVRESLLDVALLATGLLFAVYLHSSVGMSSVSGIVKAETTIMRSMALLIPKVKILHHFLKVFSHLRHYMESVHPRLQKGWSKLDLICFVAIALTVMLLLGAASIMSVPGSLIQEIMLEEMIPWNF